MGRGEMAQRVRALRLDDTEAAIPAGWRGRRWLWWLALATACAAAVLFGGRALSEKSRLVVDFFTPAHEVGSVTVTAESSVEVVLDTTGYVAAETEGKVSSSIAGTITELEVDEGDKVAAGQVLARVDDTQYRTDLDQANAGLALAKARLEDAVQGARQEEVEQAKAALAQAEANRDMVAKHLERAQQLKDTIAPAEFDRVEASHKEAEARVSQMEQALRALQLGPRREQIAALEADVKRAQALVDKAQYFISCTELKAPFSGTVLERNASLGGSVFPEATMGAVRSLFRIADLSRLNVEIDVQEQDLAKTHVGQPCVVTTEVYPDREYRGRLEWLSPVFNRQRAICQAKVRILDADEKLMPDMNCRVRILQKDSPEGLKQVIRLPAEAIVHESGETLVYVLEEGSARRREVELGPSADGRAEVEKGLRAGEIVLLPGEEPLTDGQRVRLRAQTADRAAS